MVTLKKSFIILPALVLVACSILLLSGNYQAAFASSSQPTNQSLSTVTGSEIIARAETWVDAQVTYNQQGYYNGYREDCSGYVSMAWGLPPPGLTTYSIPNHAHQINKADLEPGDVLLNQYGGGNSDLAHVVIFDGWVDATHTHYNAYEETPYPWTRPGGGANYTKDIPYPYWPGFDTADYKPYRYNGVVDDGSTPTVGSTQTNEAGHVLLVTQQSLVAEINLNPLPPRCNGPSDGAGHAVVTPGQHVVVINNTALVSSGVTYYQIAYPDPCEPGDDFSNDSLISLAEQNASVDAAVGYVAVSALSEVNSVYPAVSSAVWRDCWGPNQCNDLHASLSTLTLPSADGNVLYAWWTGTMWDPHWFHVLDPNHQGAAVYGRDWSGAPVCSQTSTNALISPLDTCSNPTPTSTPPSAPTPTPTSTSVPSSDGSQWISNSSPVTVSPGGQFSVQFTFQNTGQNTTWSDSAGYALQCDTYYHPNNNDCMGEQSVGFGGQSVSPGQQFTFTLNLTAPSSPGTYQTWWDMRHHGSIFGDNHANVQVMVQGSNPVPPPPTSPPAYDDAEFIGQSTWPTEPAGAQFSIYFVMQNTGNTTWTDGGGYYLACTSLCLGAPNTVGFNGQSIVPNQQYQFNITMWAPTTPGTYRTDWILEHNGTMFGPDLYIYVVVPVLKEQSPVCNDPSGTNWSSPNSSAVTSSCPGNGLLMQQVSSTKYAEFDLTQADEGSYNQTNFQVQVQASFQNTGDCSTWASIIFQTPTNSPGGYIFGVTPCGQWRLQQVITGTDIPTVSSGSISFNASQPVTITVNVQNDTLTASINNQQALTYSVGSPSGTLEVGLMVQRDHAEPSSEVLFSNFELDE